MTSVTHDAVDLELVNAIKLSLENDPMVTIGQGFDGARKLICVVTAYQCGYGGYERMEAVQMMLEDLEMAFIPLAKLLDPSEEPGEALINAIRRYDDGQICHKSLGRILPLVWRAD